MLVGLMRSPAQLQKVVTIDLSTHEHFATAALGEGAVRPLDPTPDTEQPTPKDQAADTGDRPKAG